jgi:hypothetical protein
LKVEAQEHDERVRRDGGIDHLPLASVATFDRDACSGKRWPADSPRHTEAPRDLGLERPYRQLILTATQPTHP